MTKDAIDQIFNRAQQGDVTAMALVGQMFLEGRYIKEDRTKAIHFLRKAAECNCLYARDLLQDELSKPFVPNGQQSHQSYQANYGDDNEGHDYMAELIGQIGLNTVKTEVESLRNSLIRILDFSLASSAILLKRWCRNKLTDWQDNLTSAMRI